MICRLCQKPKQVFPLRSNKQNRDLTAPLENCQNDRLLYFSDHTKLLKTIKINDSVNTSFTVAGASPHTEEMHFWGFGGFVCFCVGFFLNFLTA